MPPLKVLSTLAIKGVVDEVLTDLQRTAGGPVDLTYSPTAVALQSIRAGARGDLAILTEQGIEDLISEGILASGSRADLARSLVGLAVRAGSPKPDISTVDALVHTLRAAPSIVYSRGGASGIFFAGLLERLQIADLVNAKATIIASGFTAEIVARGEAELAVQQVSELMAIPGVDIIGPLPEGAQESLLFSGAVFAGSTEAARALNVLRWLTEPRLRDLYARKGLLPVSGAATPA